MTSRFRLPAAAAIMLLTVAACGQGAATSGPTAAASSTPAAATATPATAVPATAAPTTAAATVTPGSMDPRIATFCTDFTTRLATAWPPADAAAAVALGPVFADFAMNAGLSEIATDLQTVNDWTVLAARGLTSKPPTEVVHAFGRIGAFVTNNC